MPTRPLRQRDRYDNVQLHRRLQCQCWVRVQCGSDGVDGIAVSSGTVQREWLGWQLQSVPEWHVRQRDWTVDCCMFGRLYVNRGVLLRSWHDDGDWRTMYVDGS